MASGVLCIELCNMQWLAFDEQGCLFVSDLKLAMGQPNNIKDTKNTIETDSYS